MAKMWINTRYLCNIAKTRRITEAPCLGRGSISDHHLYWRSRTRAGSTILDVNNASFLQECQKSKNCLCNPKMFLIWTESVQFLKGNKFIHITDSIVYIHYKTSKEVWKKKRKKINEREAKGCKQSLVFFHVLTQSWLHARCLRALLN